MKPLRPIDCLFVSPSAASPSLPCPTNLANLVDEMDRHGIDRVLLTPCQTSSSRCDREYLCTDAVLSDLLQQVHIHPGRFSTLLGYNAADIGGSLLRMDEAITRHDVKGLFLSSGQMPLLDRRMYPAYAKCTQLRIPGVIHTNHELAGSERSPTLNEVRAIASDFPELKIVVACGGWPAITDMQGALEEYDNIYFALDANVRHDLLPAASQFLNSELAATRCVWGSNHCGWQVAVAKLDALALSDGTRAQFARENAVVLFGLESQRRPQLEVEAVLTAE